MCKVDKWEQVKLTKKDRRLSFRSSHTRNRGVGYCAFGVKHFFSLCWGLHGGTRSLMAKRSPRHTLYLTVQHWSLAGPGACLFSLQIANTKCIGPDLPLKLAVQNRVIFSYGCTEQMCTVCLG